VLRLAGMLDSGLQRAINALVEQKPDLARVVVADDERITRLRFDIEEACVGLLATQQPAASDLRMVVAAMNIVSDLERMADHAAGIARMVPRVVGEIPSGWRVHIERMAETCTSMMRESLEAFVGRDADKARALAARDNRVDALYSQMFHELLGSLAQDAAGPSRTLALLFAAHSLERTGDRAMSIAERVVFLAGEEMMELNPEPWEASSLQ